MGCGTGVVQAQVALSGTVYIQDFNSIGVGLPLGWSVRTNASSTNSGVPALFFSSPTNWSASAGQFANFASTVQNDGSPFAGSETSATQAAATNRCLGMRQTGSFGDPGAAFVLQLENTVGLANFELSIKCNMLNVQNRSNVWTIDYGIGTSPTSFIALGTQTDPAIFGSTQRSFSFGSALDNVNEPVWIRIVTLTASSGSGSRDTFGIDDVVLSYSPAGLIQSIPLAIHWIGDGAVLTWTNAAYSLETATSIDGVFADVAGATSPYTNAATEPQQFFRLRAGD